MSRYMTQDEIDAEQALIRQQALVGNETFVKAAEQAPPISEEAANAVTPLDLLDGDNYTDKATRNERLDTCKGCERLFKPTASCKECGCFMALKTWLKDASCPLGKWGAA